MLASTRFSIARLLSAITVVLAGCSAGTTYEHALSVARSGDYQRAIALFTELAKTSDDPGIYGNRANCYSYLGNLDAALADYQTAIELIYAQTPDRRDPTLPAIYYNRGTAYKRAKRFQSAVDDFEKTIALQADYPDVKSSLAWLLATCADQSVRNPHRAVELADEERARAPEEPDVLDTVAACYASAGDFNRATATQEKAVSLCSDPAARQEFNDRLELYRNETPFIDAE